MAPRQAAQGRTLIIRKLVVLSVNRNRNVILVESVHPRLSISLHSSAGPGFWRNIMLYGQFADKREYGRG